MGLWFGQYSTLKKEKQSMGSSGMPTGSTLM
jgi:hypothetical protein